MIKVSVKLNVRSMINARKGSEREIRRAAARAINRAADSGATVGSRAISKDTKIKVRQVRARISVKGATPNHLVAEIEAHPYAPNLKEFRATANHKGVAASAWEKRKTYKHAFIHPRTQRVVTRVGPGRGPLKGLRGPSVRRTFMRPDIVAKVEQAAMQRFTAEFEREVTRRLGR
jgi:hypothetical protein